MEIVLDTNILLSSLLKDGLTRKIIFLSPFEMYTVEHSKSEILIHKEELLCKSKLDGKCRVPKRFRRGFSFEPIIWSMKLTQRKIHWIIRQNQKGVTISKIALEMKVTCRRVQQIWKHYLEIGCEPVLGANLGRPRKTYDEREASIIREAYAQYGLGARMLEDVLRKVYKTCISHNRIHMYLKAEGLA